MRELPLIGKYVGHFTQVDDDIAAICIARGAKLYGTKGKADHTIYVRVYFPDTKELVYLHRFILNAPHGVLVDHEDHNGLNNQRYNIRLCNYSQNQQNRRPRVRGSSKYIGVSWNKQKGKWQAQAYFEGKDYFLGLFDIEEDAARAYDVFIKAHYDPEYRVLNFPNE